MPLTPIVDTTLPRKISIAVIENAVAAYYVFQYILGCRYYVRAPEQCVDDKLMKKEILGVISTQHLEDN